MKKKIKYKLNKKKVLVVVLLTISFFVSVTYGRYIYNGLKNYYLSSKNFYFNSDKLNEDLARYQLDNWSGVDPVTISFNMNSIRNSKVSSSYDIEYEIVYNCSPNVTCVSNKTHGLIYSTTNTDDFFITMTPNTSLNDGDSIWLEVEAEAISPYKKKLSGMFVIEVGTIGLSYEIDDSYGRSYLNFNITNTLDYYKVIEDFDSYSVGDHIDISTYLSLSEDKKMKCASSVITLSFDPNILRLDMTNDEYLKSLAETYIEIDGYDYINSVTFGIDAISSNAVRFYKINKNEDYSYPFVTDNPVINFVSN